MCAEARLSQMFNFIDRDQVFRIKGLADSYGLPSEVPADMRFKQYVFIYTA